MSDPNEYLKNFAGHSIPEDVLSLWSFEQVRQGCYSQGFELIPNDKSALSTWSEEPAFLERLVPIGQADGTGSIYAFWLPDATSALENAPIVIFGSEGGVHIVADSFRDLLRILTFDVEPMADFDNVSYYKDPEDHVPSEENADYIAWVRENFDIEPISDADQIVETARSKWGEAFKSWARQFIDVD